MNNTVLLQKLIEIERSIGATDNVTLRQLVYEPKIACLRSKRESRPGLSELEPRRDAPV